MTYIVKNTIIAIKLPTIETYTSALLSWGTRYRIVSDSSPKSCPALYIYIYIYTFVFMNEAGSVFANRSWAAKIMGAFATELSQATASKWYTSRRQHNVHECFCRLRLLIFVRSALACASGRACRDRNSAEDRWQSAPQGNILLLRTPKTPQNQKNAFDWARNICCAHSSDSEVPKTSLVYTSMQHSIVCFDVHGSTLNKLSSNQPRHRLWNND